MSMKSTRTKNPDASPFTETVRFKVLNKSDVDGNNNKFYILEVQRDPSGGEYRLFTHYGRVGAAGTMETRGPDSLFAIEKEEGRLLRDKMVKKGYREVDVAVPAGGSLNIRDKGVGGKVSVKTDLDISGMSYGKKSKEILEKLIDENVHHIKSSSSITVTGSGASTELGPVTPAHVASARRILDRLQAMPGAAASDPAVRRLNSEYFSLVPRKFGRTITDSDLVFDDRTLADEYDLLLSLEGAVAVASASGEDDLGFDLRPALKKDRDRIFKAIEGSRRHSNLASWVPYECFEVRHREQRERFKKTRERIGGRELTLFHGSRSSNVLSILATGLHVPPSSANHVTGRMFGNGVYAASSATKALNYSVGYWGGVANRHPFACLLVLQVAMGKEKTVTSSLPAGPGSGFDSVHAKSGKSLINDEYIVYDKDQATVRFMVLFKKGR